MQSVRIEQQKYLQTFDALNEMAGEAAQIQFVGDVFVAVAVV